MNHKQTIVYDLAFQELEIHLKREHLMAKRDEYIGLSSPVSLYRELLETLYSYLHGCRDTRGYDYEQLFILFKDHIESLRELSIKVGSRDRCSNEDKDFQFFNSLYEQLVEIENRNTLWYRANEGTVTQRQEA